MASESAGRPLRRALWIGALLAAAAIGAAAAEAIPAKSPGGAGAMAFATAPTLERINRACAEDPACRGRADNRNFYDLLRVSQRVTAGDCSREEFVRRYGHEPCPNDMAWVCSPKWQVNICMDKDLRREAGGRYMGDVGRLECKAWCEQRGRRLPTNNEWMVACEGTKPSQCLRSNIAHPIMARLRDKQPWVYNNIDCKVGTNAWRDCMQDLRLNDRVIKAGMTLGVPTPAETQSCVSDYGVRNMVGVLGQWVADTYPGPGGGTRGQFNGGLYPQPASSCNYTTVAHPADYSDYSIGCRCSGEIDTRVTAAKASTPKIKKTVKPKAPAKTPVKAAPRPAMRTASAN